PTLFTFGPLEVRYYGLMWALALGLSAYIFSNLIKREGYSEKIFDSIFWYGVLSTIIGARVGHCLFYDPGYYLTHPIEILYIHQGGLASHGAAIGLLVGLWLFSRKNKMSYLWALDRITIAVCISGALVRIGNLMNSEIYGTVTSLPWGFIFVRNQETLPMHPTQLYEAFFYFLLFGLLCWMYYRRNLAHTRQGFMFGIFLIALFGFRFFVEFIKNPQEEFERNMMLDMGQWLSIPFVILGVVILYRSLRRPSTPVPAAKTKHTSHKNA
ncbi:MAG: prolipoprotein diacylglyceryl transferase, partial [Alistipes sp.]|nr:prolipoprotein diacylglyceryl transferase [Alistipes sp.]